MYVASKQRPQTVSVSILCHVEFSIGFYHDKNLVWSVEVDMFWASFWRVGEPASLVNHVSLPLYRVSRSRWRSARGRVGVNGSCTLSNKIFQNSRRSIRGIAKCCFVHFLHFATFFPETATFQSKNVTFIILIFSELNIIGS